MSAKPHVLFVDDEPELLSSIRVSLRKSFCVVTAESGPEGLDLLRDAEAADAPDVVAVVSDMRMPEMTGAQFLTIVRSRYPDLPRILLTGHADLESAVSAVNDAKIFRFLTKPCSAQTLVEAVQEAIEHSRLRTAERELLDQTLNGVVGMLTDVLGLVSVGAHTRTLRLVALVNEMCAALDRPVGWDLALAARLSQLGWVVVSDSDGDPLPGQVDSHHAVIAADLLQNIPRLDAVARIVAHQEDTAPLHSAPTAAGWSDDDLNVELLRLAVRFDELVCVGSSRTASLAALSAHETPSPPFLLEALSAVQPAATEPMVEIATSVRQLAIGMEIAKDITLSSGSKLVSAGVVLTPVLLGRIRTFSQVPGITEPVHVVVPASAARGLAPL